MPNTARLAGSGTVGVDDELNLDFSSVPIAKVAIVELPRLIFTLAIGAERLVIQSRRWRVKNSDVAPRLRPGFHACRGGVRLRA